MKEWRKDKGNRNNKYTSDFKTNEKVEKKKKKSELERGEKKKERRKRKRQLATRSMREYRDEME